jgi:hypothetical protein
LITTSAAIATAARSTTDSTAQHGGPISRMCQLVQITPQRTTSLATLFGSHKLNFDSPFDFQHSSTTTSLNDDRVCFASFIL